MVVLQEDLQRNIPFEGKFNDDPSKYTCLTNVFPIPKFNNLETELVVEHALQTCVVCLECTPCVHICVSSSFVCTPVQQQALDSLIKRGKELITCNSNL